VNKVRRSDPEVAFAWAATVGDVDQRQRLTRYALRDFAKEEPEQVKELIRTSDLSEEEKEKLNKLVKD